MKTSLHPLFASLAFALSLSLLIGCGSSSSDSESESDDGTDSSLDIKTGDEVSMNENKVLRHGVYFSFKEESSPEEVMGVVEAFKSLPGKIDVITDFEWGETNSAAERSGGFTHCFFLTFADEEGRSIYIPHEDHAQGFADALRPHMKDVFVFDYWGDKNAKVLEKTLRHTVFFKFKEGTSEADIANVEKAFAELPNQIEEIKAFEWGINNSPEGKEDGFTHCFLLSYDSAEDLATYDAHEAHQEFKGILGPVLDEVRVLDYWVTE